MSRRHTSVYALTTLASLALAWFQPLHPHDHGQTAALVASALLGEPWHDNGAATAR